ncbi:unnamed protein product [Chrysodeixis includens]|uniref:protein kinase C n=1 Tax=Chrysodeixis includens TaxID=689277 RepID=A0A9N8Q0S7_CHRIL|nr:unnamed protein product [Chrysodeixis includens]
MRSPAVSWTQAVEGARECAWQLFYCSLNACEKIAAAHALVEPYPNLDVVVAGPTYSAQLFPNVPAAPGMPCAGEDRSIYRRGARRWRKLYRVNGHIFQAKRFNRRAFCAFCQDRIWGLGRQGFKCIQCKLLVHKKCHKLVQKPCSNEHVDPIEVKDDANGESTLGRASSVRSRAEVEPPLPETPPAPAPAPRDDLEPGSQRQYSLDDFELIRVIGRGSYAKVLMVELKRTKRVYAMKVIKKALVTDDEDIDWVQTEKHVFETASNHPFLVGLHSCFQTPSRLFFVIEFVILEKTIRIPRSLSVKAASVLKGFLNKSPGERLGCGENGFLDIVSHPFFKSIEWEMLEQKQVVPPFKPRLEGERDLANFPPEFTDEPVHLTPDNDTVIADIDQSEFEGFEYVNPLLMSLEDCV